MNEKEITRANLKLLRDYLELNYDYISERFDMSYYRIDNEYESFPKHSFYKNKHDCGTHGCLLGWVPFAMGHEIPKELFAPSREGEIYLDWERLTEHCFPSIPMMEDISSWDFLFSGLWEDYDNTLEGAIARIDIVLAGDFIWEN